MRENERILNIWAEKTYEYIWLHNAYINYTKRINNCFCFSISLLSYSTGIILLFYKPDYQITILFGLINILTAFLFTIYIILEIPIIFERHRMTKSRLLSFLDEIYQEFRHIENNELDKLQLFYKQNEFERIITKSPHVPKFIADKFFEKFHHFIKSKPYFHTYWFLNINPKDNRTIFYNLIYLFRYFNGWKCSIEKKNKILFPQMDWLPVTDEDRYLYTHPLKDRKRFLNLKNVKLRKNNLEIHII